MLNSTFVFRPFHLIRLSRSCIKEYSHINKLRTTDQPQIIISGMFAVDSWHIETCNVLTLPPNTPPKQV